MGGGPEWIAIDWGTSNVRAWGIDSNGAVTFERSSTQGMGKITREQYPGILLDLVGEHTSDAPCDVLICGMAGARQGWKEVPYLETPAELRGLAWASVPVEVPGSALRPRILPGISHRAHRAEDVMRGEETQLLGLTSLQGRDSFLAVLPGTHSKWVPVSGGIVEAFNTIMTGELYEVLSVHSVLRHSLSGELIGPETEAGVAEGMEEGLRDPGRLTALLFRTRAASLLSNRGSDWCAGYLSGLLVGAEVGAAARYIGQQKVYIVGTSRLSRLYSAALARINAAFEAVEAAGATLAGLKLARQGL